jgi:hypothetical protein
MAMPSGRGKHRISYQVCCFSFRASNTLAKALLDASCKPASIAWEKKPGMACGIIGSAQEFDSLPERPASQSGSVWLA